MGMEVLNIFDGDLTFGEVYNDINIDKAKMVNKNGVNQYNTVAHEVLSYIDLCAPHAKHQSASTIGKVVKLQQKYRGLDNNLSLQMLNMRYSSAEFTMLLETNTVIMEADIQENLLKELNEILDENDTKNSEKALH